MQRQQQGFTLIELVIVIVILGILSAFALPRFADLSGDAELAAVEGARGSVKSAEGIIRSKALASGNGSSSQDDAIALEEVDIDLQNGYLAASSVVDAAQLEDFTTTPDPSTDPASVDVTTADAAQDSPCFTFTEADGTTDPVTPPQITSITEDWDTGSDSCNN